MTLCYTVLMSSFHPQKKNTTKNNYLSLKIYLWALLLIVLAIVAFISMIYSSPVGGWLVLLYYESFLLFLCTLAVVNIIFLVFQLMRHRLSGLLWITPVVVIIVSAAYLAFAIPSLIEYYSYTKTDINEQQRIEDQKAFVPKEYDMSVQTARQLLGDCKVSYMQYVAMDSPYIHESRTGVLASEIDKGIDYTLAVVKDKTQDLMAYATEVKTHCGGWPHLPMERLRNEAPWGQHAGKTWTP